MAKREIKGKVYLVGAGPGDRNLITIKGAKVLSRADVVIYDYLVPKEMSTMAKQDAKIIPTSSLRKNTLYTEQKKINRLLVNEAKKGKTVVRLKAGDPLIFGRGKEELTALEKAGVSYSLVPGVTAGIAAANAKGVCLTDSLRSSTVTFVAGHESSAKKYSLIDWQALSKVGTLVFYMGVGALAKIVRQLLQNGKQKETAVTIIENVSRNNERVISGTLRDIVKKAKNKKVKPPAIIIIQ